MGRAGPAWLGLGGQRCGSTWLTDLLTQHPQVDVVDGRKELHVLYRGLTTGPDRQELAGYGQRFESEHLLGECTPYYLRAIWAPSTARRVLDDSAVVWCILRDPIERFASGLRHEMQRADARSEVRDGRWERLVGSDATWAGMYADHLAAWARVLGPERLTVLQYEVVKRDPEATIHRLWRAMGLEPVALVDVDHPSVTSTHGRGFDLTDHPDLAEALRELYLPQAERLSSDWGIDVDAWPNLT